MKSSKFNYMFSSSSSRKERLQWSNVARWGHQPHHSSPLRLNVYVTTFFVVQLQVQLACKRVHRVCTCDLLRQIVPWGRLKKMCSQRVSWCSFTRKKLKWISSACFIFAPVLVFCFHGTSLFSLDHIQSCKSVWNRNFLVFFSGLSNQVFRTFFCKAGRVILSWWMLCTGPL